MVAENDWNDPRNEFPAVLFRLSYRTNDKYRSGYRDGDEDGDWPQKVVNSMRGWWEFEGDDVRALHDQQALGAEYAVAFHQGRTVAVVQVDGWHWIAGLHGDEHHRQSVDELLTDRSEGQESGSLEDERWCQLECSGQRLRWAFKAKPASEKVWAAWVGANGTGIVGMRRDAVVSIWPYSLADDQRDLIERAMRILGEVVQEYLVRDLGHQDLRRIRELLLKAAVTDEARRELGPCPEESRDPSLWLKFVCDNWNGWDRVQACFPSFQLPSFFRQLLRLRNRWAHFAYREQVTVREIDNLRRMVGLFDEIGAARAGLSVDFIRRVLDAQVKRRNGASTAS